MNKKANGTKTPTKKSKTNARVRKSNLDKKNSKDTVTKVVESKREVKWKMPKEGMTTDEKRSFRQAMRRKMRKMESELHKNPSNKLRREYKSFRKEVLLAP